MLRAIKEKIDSIQQTRYVFEYIGDLLPMHFHQPWDYHDTLVIRGSVKISGPDGWEIIAKKGDNILYDDWRAMGHQIEALEDNTEIINKNRAENFNRKNLEHTVCFDVLHADINK